MAGRTREHNGKTYTISEAHPAAELFPWLEGSELDEFVEDIRTGQREDIHRWKGVIVDGRNRELACLIAGIRPKYKDLPASTSEDQIIAGIISRNIKRRHLTVSQRAMIAAELATLQKGEHRSKSANLRISQSEAATRLGVSERSIQSAAKVVRAAPELKPAVQSGTLPVSTAARLAEYPAEVRRKVIESEDPKETANELLTDMEDAPEPMDDSLPRPSLDASPEDKREHPLYGKSKNRKRDLREHKYYHILKAMSDLSRMLTIAMNEPDGAKLKDNLRYMGLVMDRGFILNGKKYNAKFRGFPFRVAVKVSVGRKVYTKAELLAIVRQQWEDENDDFDDVVPE